MEIPKYIVFRVDVMRKGTSVELTNITDEVEDVIFKADRKTEPTISKMEQVDKDINVRSKDEPRKEQNFCGKCRYLYRDFKYGLSCYRLMDNEPCKYEERKDEPQTDCAWGKHE